MESRLAYRRKRSRHICRLIEYMVRFPLMPSGSGQSTNHPVWDLMVAGWIVILPFRLRGPRGTLDQLAWDGKADWPPEVVFYSFTLLSCGPIGHRQAKNSLITLSRFVGQPLIISP